MIVDVATQIPRTTSACSSKARRRTGRCRFRRQLDHAPRGVKRFSFKLDGLPPNMSPEGAALKLTLVGGKSAYEFNINLN